MKSAQAETTVLRNLSKSLNETLSQEIALCELNEISQSEYVDKNTFQARAYSRFINILLKEVEQTNKQLLFKVENP